MPTRKKITGNLFFILSCLIFLASMQNVFSKVVKMEITSRQIFAEGMTFEPVGAYEKIKGRLHYSIDPDNVSNSRIVDLKYAPRNEKGKIEWMGDFILLKPVDLNKGNHRIIFDVNNRGNLTILGSMNRGLGSNDPLQPAHAGNGFLMKEGYTILSAEWNWDVQPGMNRMQLDLPIARINGKSITQKIAAEITLIQSHEVTKSQSIAWGNSRGYPASDINDRSTSRLTVRNTPRGKRILIPNNQWRFARLEGDRIIPDPTSVYLEQGFHPGKIYELIYIAKDPRVQGLGLASARDAISFFRFNTRDGYDHINPLTVSSNGSLKPDTEKVYIFGISQSGRFIVHMIYQGFHVDEANRMVIDGARIHVAGAGKGGFNHRFGFNTHIGLHLESNYMPGDFFPFNYAPQVDPLTGEKGDVLSVAKKLGQIPYIMITNNEAEYWTRAASLIHTDVLGKKDAPLHKKVRIYLTCGAAHYASPTRAHGICQHSLVVIDHYPISRALLKALDRWVTDGIEPPPNAYPRIDKHELITPAQHKKKFPAIPGMRHPGRNYQPPRVNFGEKFREEGIITIVPPKMGEAYITLVPTFDSDGNSIGGIRLPELAVPLGTYQGWNPRRAEYGAPNFLAPFEGSFWPFAKTEAERKKNHDPRPSIEARYPTKKNYVNKIKKAVKDLIEKRYLLKEDGNKYIRDAENLAWPPESIDRYPFWKQEKSLSEPVFIKLDAKILDNYVGQYEFEPGVIIEVKKEKNDLYLHLDKTQKFQLYPETEAKFFVKEIGMDLNFIRGESGKIVGIILHTDRGDYKIKRVE